jgi:hypothetical protein
MPMTIRADTARRRRLESAPLYAPGLVLDSAGLANGMIDAASGARTEQAAAAVALRWALDSAGIPRRGGGTGAPRELVGVLRTHGKNGGSPLKIDVRDATLDRVAVRLSLEGQRLVCSMAYKTHSMTVCFEPIGRIHAAYVRDVDATAGAAMHLLNVLRINWQTLTDKASTMVKP